MLQNPAGKPVTNPAAGAPSGNSSTNSYRIVFLFAALTVFAWVGWTSAWDTGLYGDNVEQFVWSHSMELGYYKHPPLPTWLMGLAISAIGSHWWLTNALAAACVAATGLFTWLTARELCGERTANIAIVLWGLQQCFSVSAEIYNHNTVLVLCMSALTYSVLRALSSSRDTRWWLASGVLAACAMLAKYQAALPLLALVAAIFLTARTRRTYLLWRLALVLLVFFIFFGPHLYWGISNRFPSLRYASEVIESGGLVRRASWVLTFAVNQARMVLPLLLAIMLAALIARFSRRNTVNTPFPVSPSFNPVTRWSDREISIWLRCLVWGPIVALILVSLLSGSALRNHWGVQLFQFLSIWIAWRWRASAIWDLRRLVTAAVLVHAAGFLYYAIKQSDETAALADRRADSSYPGQRMSDAAIAHWKRFSNCPVRIVAGDFEAGLVSAYAKGSPVVFTAAVATPWVGEADIERYGALYVFDRNTTLPANVLQTIKWSLSSGVQNDKYVQFAVRLPASPCPAGP